jgi:metallo-beta-lactamase family protein
MKLTFLGASRQVTGSQFLVESGTTRFLVDCGLNQGEDDRAEINREPFGFDPRTLDFMVLTHAHLDHCGLIPRLFQEGFRGRVYSTRAGLDLARIVLLDSAKIQEEDARFELRRWKRNRLPGPTPGPIYTIQEAQQALDAFRPYDYEQPIALTPDITLRFLDAGHILGAASLDLTLMEGGRARRLAFSGDLGRRDRPILCDPVLPAPCDAAVMESTYGARDHDSWEETQAKFSETVATTLARGGHVIIPAFAIGRSQDVLFCLSAMVRNKEIPVTPIFMDSPMALEATEAFLRHQEYFDDETRQLMAEGRSPFDFPGLSYVRSVEESMALNDMEEPFIVISASGMCTGGRIRHHLHHHLGHERDEILFVGYQAVDTLGAAIVGGAKTVELFHETQEVRAHVSYLEGFSAHASQKGLIDWATKVVGQGEKLFIVHGERDGLIGLSEALEGKIKAEVIIPYRGESFEA